MYLDAALGSQNAFGVFYAYCQTRQDGAAQKLEFLQMARVLNPFLGPHARDFFPAFLRTTQERAAHLYSVIVWRDLSQDTLMKLHATASLGQLGAHSFDMAYVELLRDADHYAWSSFVSTREGEGINAWRYEMSSGAERIALDLKLKYVTEQANVQDCPVQRRDVTARTIGLNLSPKLTELMLRQRTNEGLKAMAECRLAELAPQASIAKEQIPPLAPKAVPLPAPAAVARPQLYRPSSRSAVPMPIPAPAAAPVAAAVLPAAMPARAGHHRRVQAVFASPLQTPAAASSASSAASVQSRAEIGDAFRRRGKCVPEAVVAGLNRRLPVAPTPRLPPPHIRVLPTARS
jgi:hypothetical protein